ncbi:MAG: aminotransferase class III-fold pyridoxal phosphate-dependent enzyme [Proteobacteria bacterium]|nr:aminotransferase class III-fold pyridoxal phosphate-dependent enzyme [Pseudomonadota bacterium]
MMNDITSGHELLKEAQNYFPKALISDLAARGHDFFESGSDGVWLYDEKGNAILDAHSSGGTHNLGRSRPELGQALLDAAEKTDQGNFVLVSKEKVRLVERLARFLPYDLSCMLFTVVRGEAMDAACKVARGHTGRTELITVDGGWYGQTGFAMSLSDRMDKADFGPLIPGVKTLPFGDGAAAEKEVTTRTAAVILEPVQAENGCRMATREYLRQLRRVCDQKGALLILDETQTGFGRTGTKFACEGLGASPDILIFGEALAGGMFPMCGLAFPPRIKSFFDKHPLIHLCTFGGHDVGCLVADKALELYDTLKPWNNAQKQGERILNGLRPLAGEYPGTFRSVAGLGLLLSIQLTSTEKALVFCKAARTEGLFCVPGEVLKSSIMIRPPLTLTDEESDKLLKAIQDTLKRI